jgi:hypothetical protein
VLRVDNLAFYDGKGKGGFVLLARKARDRERLGMRRVSDVEDVADRAGAVGKWGWTWGWGGADDGKDGIGKGEEEESTSREDGDSVWLLAHQPGG